MKFETILEAYDKVIIKNMWPRSDKGRRRGRRQRAAFRARLVKMYREIEADYYNSASSRSWRYMATSRARKAQH